jgi:hypothetical protein
MQVNMTLLDVNDNAPYFPASSVFKIEVREETTLPDAIYIAHAIDPDLGNNGSVSYRLNTQYSTLFTIDSVSCSLLQLIFILFFDDLISLLIE